MGAGFSGIGIAIKLEEAGLRDYLIVEAHTVGEDDWTTLPDANGLTTNDLSNDQSCPGGWSNPNDAANVLHPFLTHYQTFQQDGTCTATAAWPFAPRTR